MSTLAIELNDAAIAVASELGVRAVEPGCAVAEEKGLLVGTPAARVARLKPRQLHDRYWADLSVDQLERPLPGIQNTADIAYAQLTDLWQRFGDDGAEVLLAIPGSFSREQLSLILGIAQAGEIPVRGLVDTAAAACDRAYPGWTVIHLEAQRHSIGLTRIGQEPKATVEGYETVVATGVADLHERWARKLAAQFVAEARFDPFASGATEQRLYDALPSWLELLAQHPVAKLQFTDERGSRAIELGAKDLAAEAEDVYGAVVAAVQRARTSTRGVVAHVGAVLASQPGLVDRLRELPRVEVALLPEGAAALGAIARRDEVRSAGGRLGLAKTLSWRRPAAELEAPSEHAAASAPTHVVCRGRAHRIGAAGLRLGLKSGRIDVAEDGDFRLAPREGRILLEAPADRSARVNRVSVQAPVSLEIGDRVSLDDASDELWLIELADDGA